MTLPLKQFELPSYRNNLYVICKKLFQCSDIKFFNISDNIFANYSNGETG